MFTNNISQIDQKHFMGVAISLFLVFILISFLIFKDGGGGPHSPALEWLIWLNLFGLPVVWAAIFMSVSAMKKVTLLAYWGSTRCPQIRRISRKAVGRSFELLTVNALKRYHFNVWLCGGTRDRGIDFRGFWKLNSRTVNLLGQCKCYKRRLGPVHVRELEGAISHEHQASLALLVTNTGFTKDAYEHFMSSTYPLALTVLDNSTVLHHCYDKEALHPTYFSKNDISLINLQDKIEVCSQEEPKVDFLDKNTADHENLNQSLQFEQEVVLPPQDDNDHWTNDQDCSLLPHEGNISLFELNIRARQLLPQVVIGRPLKKPGNPLLLLHEDSSIKNI